MRNYLAGHHYGVFDELETALLGSAFDEARLIVQASPDEYLFSDNAELRRETLAASIVNAAALGERGLAALRTAGLLSLARSLA